MPRPLALESTILIHPPRVPPGCVVLSIAALDREDRDAARRRSNALPWASRIVRGPYRVCASKWTFYVRKAP